MGDQRLGWDDGTSGERVWGTRGWDGMRVQVERVWGTRGWGGMKVQVEREYEGPEVGWDEGTSGESV